MKLRSLADFNCIKRVNSKMDSKIKSKLLTEIRVFLDAFFSYRYNIESAGKKYVCTSYDKICTSNSCFSLFNFFIDKITILELTIVITKQKIRIREDF